MQTQTKRMSVGTKIWLIAGSFSLPIAVLMYLMLNSINENIAFARKELQGNAYLRPLEDLLQAIFEVEFVRHGCNASCEERRRAAFKHVEQAFARLEEVDRMYGVSLQFTEEGLAKRGRSHLRPAQLRKKWEQVASGGDSSSLIQDLRAMITHAGDTSNLILDPDLDSYYLMDVTLLALPQAQWRMGRAAAAGAALLTSAHPEPKDRLRLMSDAALMKEADLERVIASTTTAFNEDANFYGTHATLRPRLEPALQQYRQAHEKFIAVTQEISETEGTNWSAAAYLEAAKAALDASFACWRAAVDELDGLLETRIASYQHKKRRALLLAALALLAACGLAYALARSITKPLSGLAQSLGPGATLLSVCVERIAEHSQQEKPDREEAGLICQELNAHAEEMRKAVLELLHHVQGSSAEVAQKGA